MDNEYITIGKDKNGEWDFGVCGIVQSIPLEEMDNFRSICMVAFRVADNMWLREREEENPPMQNNNAVG